MLILCIAINRVNSINSTSCNNANVDKENNTSASGQRTPSKIKLWLRQGSTVSIYQALLEKIYLVDKLLHCRTTICKINMGVWCCLRTHSNCRLSLFLVIALWSYIIIWFSSTSVIYIYIREFWYQLDSECVHEKRGILKFV